MRSQRHRARRAPLLPAGGASLAGLFALALAASSGRAHASPTYPGELQSQLGMECAPPCTICHRDLAGGFGTVDKPFGMAMLAAGLPAASPERLADALATLRAEGTDGDADGAPDVEELEAGGDPNGEGVLCGSEGPTYGCGARIAPRGAGDAYVATAALGLALALAALRRQKRAAR